MKSGFTHVVMASMVLASISAPFPAMARKADSLTDINGARGSSAEGMLQDRGFKYITGNKNSMGYVYSYWWHSSDKNCVQVEVYNGLVETISDAKDGDCNHSGGKAGTAAAVAGLAILGAALASKSHHRKGKDYSEQETGEFDRGYKDGLYNAPYHNYGTSNAYSDGYQVGVDERNANLSHHSGHGGYAPHEYIADIKGMDAIKAFDAIRERGFTNVDSFSSGNTNYGIFYNRNTGQCVQTTNADGRVYDIRDIKTHPKCR